MLFCLMLRLAHRWRSRYAGFLPIYLLGLLLLFDGIVCTEEALETQPELASIIRSVESSLPMLEDAVDLSQTLDDSPGWHHTHPGTFHHHRQPQHQAWINSGKFQGDIAGVDEYSFLAGAKNVYRNAVKDRSLRWPNGVVPYHVAPVFSESERKIIDGAISTYREKTCLQFVPWTNERDYIYFFKDYGCYSLVGRVGGRQELSLGRGCIYHEIIVHEMMHTLGFWHEQSRADRDQHITIKWENILPGMRAQFDKIDYAYSDFLDERYDYYSVMHYDSTAFSRNGQNTIETVQNGMTKIIGTALDLSAGDLRRINALYECQNHSPQPGTRKTTPASTAPPHAPAPTPTSTEKGNECVDTFMDCPFFFRYCFRQSFQSVMKQYCPRSCGFCSTAPINSKQIIEKPLIQDVFLRPSDAHFWTRRKRR